MSWMDFSSIQKKLLACAGQQDGDFGPALPPPPLPPRHETTSTESAPKSPDSTLAKKRKLR